jgi:hypothetical protein
MKWQKNDTKKRVIKMLQKSREIKCYKKAEIKNVTKPVINIWGEKTLYQS